MKSTRRDWLKLTGSAALAASLPRLLSAVGADEQRFLRDYEKPAFDLPGQIKEPVKIASIEMLKRGSNYFVRTEKILRLAREKLGDKTILYADANGSYNPAKAIEIGRMMESLNYQFFEEPCPFEELSETQEVARALKIPVAFGEQNYSLWQF